MDLTQVGLEWAGSADQSSSAEATEKQETYPLLPHHEQNQSKSMRLGCRAYIWFNHLGLCAAEPNGMRWSCN